MTHVRHYGLEYISKHLRGVQAVNAAETLESETLGSETLGSELE